MLSGDQFHFLPQHEQSSQIHFADCFLPLPLPLALPHHHHQHQPFPNINNMSIHDYILNNSNCNNNNNNYNSPSLSSSTSDEAEEQNLRIIDERKQRRMISNRESARRSRMRKQKHLDELWSQVVRLRSENHTLLDKLNHVSESHDRVLEENARLKEEASGLRQLLTDLPIGSPYTRDLDNVLHLTPHSSSNDDSVATSVDLLL